ncbi:hypothetical protein Syun_014978 [Stephania yunnanensis]|uniref:non-specific serine/threonine protein kinase n=1 Tax=Stephania yunnanensis TaxID=152371 RepID=A0AAP0JM24_9MAGN
MRAVVRISRRIASMGEVSKFERSLDGIDLRCKIVDNQFSEEIQTRQYRAPEIILDSGYSFSVDMWSFACIVFELATGDLMFAPSSVQGYSDDEHNRVLIGWKLGIHWSLWTVEDVLVILFANFPEVSVGSVVIGRESGDLKWSIHLGGIATNGSRWKSFFDRYGDLKRIRRLKLCPLDRLLVEKYNFLASDAREFSNFLCPLLDFAPERRPTAQQCLQHPWIELKTRNNACEIKRDASVEKLETGINKRVQIKVGP